MAIDPGVCRHNFEFTSNSNLRRIDAPAPHEPTAIRYLSVKLTLPSKFAGPPARVSTPQPDLALDVGADLTHRRVGEHLVQDRVADHLPGP